MVVWLNGSFGVGKTTVANELVKKLDDAFLYDPENLGAFLRDNLKYSYNDYQDYCLWRKLNYEIIKDLNDHYKYIIIPMTLTNKDYYNEIIGNLISTKLEVKHIILTASKEIINKRLNGRIDTTEWSYKQVDRCLKAFENDIPGEKINTDNKNVNDIVIEIINIVKEGD